MPRHEKTITLIRRPLSQNERDRLHWGARKKIRHSVSIEAFVLARDAGIPPAQKCEFRELRIMGYRFGRSIDPDNLVGGQKDVVDGLRDGKIVYNDSKKWCLPTYDQRPAQTRQDERLEVTVVWWDAPWERTG